MSWGEKDCLSPYATAPRTLIAIVRMPDIVALVDMLVVGFSLVVGAGVVLLALFWASEASSSCA